MTTTLHIRQSDLVDGQYTIRLTLKRPGKPDLEAEASISFAMQPSEQADLRWYLEEYLQVADQTPPLRVQQIEAMMKSRGEELYNKVLAANQNTQAIWFAIRNDLADLRIEIASSIAAAASIPWELMRDSQSDSAIALRVRSFVRAQSSPNIDFIPVPELGEDGRIRLLYVVCRPGGTDDVALRAVANRLLHDLKHDRARFDITALRPPTFERLQEVLTDANAAGRPFHIVHFDGHGKYADLSQSNLRSWLQHISPLILGGKPTGKHGYLCFEHDSDEGLRPVHGSELGQLLHDTGVPVLVLNACQSAMHEAAEQPEPPAPHETVHDEVRAIGSLAQSVIDQGIPAVLGMRYSVYVVTAAQYIGELYAALAKGRGFGQAATEARKHLHANPDRWVGLQPRPLQDWCVPVVYEAQRLELLPTGKPVAVNLEAQAQLDPVQRDPALRRYVPDTGFIGRDETLLLLDRAFDAHTVVLLHGYAGQGKTSTAIEFAQWYAQTGGLGPQPDVLFTSFEQHDHRTTLPGLLDQIAQRFDPLLKANSIEWNTVTDPQQRRSLIIQMVQQIPILWIWDNVELVAGFPAGTASQWTDEEQEELADFLKQIKLDTLCQARILLTSRRDEQSWLGGIPRRINMQPMSRADAANLALALGKDHNLNRADMQNWHPLLTYCHGNPLTVRILVGQAVKEGHRTREQIDAFVEAIRSGELAIADEDETQGRDRSLGASLAYGFEHAFSDEERPIIALLHLFQGTVDRNALAVMEMVDDPALPELQGWTRDQLGPLLDRAVESGLLTRLGLRWYNIHPALPWFLHQCFHEHYDGRDSRSTADAALHAWVQAVAFFGNSYHIEYTKGKREVMSVLPLEEDNLLHARRTARARGWWDAVIASSVGLHTLYEYQGRGADLKRLVEEITPDYCDPQDQPVPGREDYYSVVMAYRVRLALAERNFPRAAAMQEKVAAWDRNAAADALALPDDAPMDESQRKSIHSLSVSVSLLGQILREQGDARCVAAYEEVIGYDRRIKETTGEAIAHYNIGHAYKNIESIRDLDAAEAAYQRSLTLGDPNDALSVSRGIKQIGMVHHVRFLDARARGEPAKALMVHVQAAARHYLKALQSCPPAAVNDLGPMHSSLGNLYAEIGEFEDARKHYENGLQFAKQIGDRLVAGQTRINLALLEVSAAEHETDPPRQRDRLKLARAYAEAAITDIQDFQGGTTAEEARTQRILDYIDQMLAALPPGVAK